MLPKSSEEGVITMVLMLVLALWGGLANYVYRIKAGAVQRFSFIELLGEWVISGFSGVMVYLLASHYHVEPLLTAAMVGVAGHAGARTTFYVERMFSRKLTNLTEKINKGQ